ncbi:hypothetical protein GR212_33555 [Rhizobium lusitanum]|uniref:Uncharacterized protein n=1 Tax=Rhizobium lusitanum TaxID=293958 RepID=A0A6L9UK51_9HYPH|nr:hypothetical protein [Rhizobium lusitanum]
MPEIDTDGHRGTLAAFSKQGKTLRQMVESRLGRSTRTMQFVGTSASVAERMGEAIDAIGGDGFLIHAFPLTRRYVARDHRRARAGIAEARPRAQDL